MISERSKRRLAWSVATGWVAAIYLAIPMARAVQKAVTEHIGRSFFGFIVIAAIGAGFAGMLYLLVFRLKIRSPGRYAWLAAVTGVFIVVTIQRWKVPEEAMHFLEYGLLGILLFAALRRSVKDITAYADAMILGSIAGLVDEIIQWVVPGRNWDFRDAGFNILASVLIQIAIWRGVRPQSIREPVTPRSIRRLSVLLGIFLVLFGLCLSNTPDRVQGVAKAFPALSFLEKEEPMRERTHRFRDPEIGVFHSRLIQDVLRRTDEERAQEFGKILREWNGRSYEEFLSMFSTIHNPFLHEMRVHIFRRDKMAAQAGFSGREKAVLQPEERAGQKENRADKGRREALFAAYKENLILEKYYPRTLELSGYRWSRQKSEAGAAALGRETTRPYISPVASAGGGWFASLSDAAAWGFIAACIAALAVVNIVFRILYRKHHNPEHRFSRTI